MVSDFRHETAITSLYPNELGTRTVFFDATSSAYLYNPVDDRTLPIPKLPPSTRGVLWDSADWGERSRPSHTFSHLLTPPHAF